MPLEPLTLDDLDWAQLTEASRLRIPAVSGGRWTLHAAVDPGVTIGEVQAWLLDQRVYWMDRVPEPLFRAVIELLGERMRPVGVARTVVALERDAPATFVPAGTTLELARAAVGPVFSIEGGIELLDVAGGLGLRAGGIERDEDLAEGRGVTLFHADGAPGAFELTLRLAGPPAPPARPMSLAFELETAAKVAPEWGPEAAAVAPAAAITWWYSAGPGAPARPFPADEVLDGTGGLRRSGLVRLPVMPDWAPSGPAQGGFLPYAIIARTDAATFTHPVRAHRITPNAALAAHRRAERWSTRLEGWLPLPGREIELPDSLRPPLPESVRVRVRERDGRWHRYRAVADFARSGPTDRVFRVDRARGALVFGDGLTGRIPRPDESAGRNVRIVAAVGGGDAGDVSTGVEVTGVDVADARGVTLVDAQGGREAETVTQARTRISGLLERVERAVTAKDHETLAESTPGIAIARARAAVGYHCAHPCRLVPGAVTVFIVPWAPRGDEVAADDRVGAPVPDTGALAAVQARLERARLVGEELFVSPPRYRTVRLAVRVLGDPADAADVRRRVDAAIRRFLDPLEGGDDRAGWPFGDPLRPSALMREAGRAVEGGAIEAVAIGLDGSAPGEDCDEVAIGPHDLPALADVAVTFEPNRRARAGGLR